MFLSIKETVDLTKSILNYFHIFLFETRPHSVGQVGLEPSFLILPSAEIMGTHTLPCQALLFYFNGSFPLLCYPLHVGVLHFPHSFHFYYRCSETGDCNFETFSGFS